MGAFGWSVARGRPGRAEVVFMTGPLTVIAARHPLDPDPVPSTKATAVFVLGVVAVITGPLVGGLVPAVIALLLARQARAELVAGGGYLTGADRLRQGEVLAVVGLALAAVSLVVAALAAVLTAAGGPIPYDFPDTVD
jgi:hydroxylaminobenzene mutase